MKKIAVVTLSHSLEEEDLCSDELVDQIRREVNASPLSKSWTVERVTVLDDSPYQPKMIVRSSEDVNGFHREAQLEAQ